MASKPKKAKAKRGRPRPGRIAGLRASALDEVSKNALDEELEAARWNRPVRERVCLRLDVEVLDWFKSAGPGYQSRINQTLRKVMKDGKKAKTHKSGSQKS
jgi:uncharacterized protein (DUF4415 family)